MSSIQLLLVAISLSMDALAVAICKGFAMKKVFFKQAALVALFFGGFQAGMPIIGYLLGIQFRSKIEGFDHWIAFVLLAGIGINMIIESRGKIRKTDDSLSLKNITVLAIATSIDALAMGISFACLDVEILPAAALIGIVTFILTLIGVQVGHLFGCKLKSKAELIGGFILIGIGVKILLEHTGVI